MINVLKLKAKLKEQNLTQEATARLLGINPSTFNKKINDVKGEYMTVEEACKLKEILNISNDEVDLYFFCQLT
ncbi:hypothetical protein IX317_000598 [Fusobacterium sp. DD29]|uniref:helix-turn-helix domain-containing protein n=1 Tax=unclassified Fusobacterium TaxID=2648384 RepID=UPI001B8AC82D|nr:MULTISPECIES: helix-turn-helix transcriptional regulator [unclassified Fusobacterium]MBR8700280.1 hypothetical protein [Fusobacterium sp. DD45]MBR8710465.1 hypothetical protein [Fusobacterium sp. DD28]MBR8748937.1 hypothetical protein [Fusobacterium sp. DD29]MBR8751085.1 hypothetical protein [Fusobacterium sp. DD26]MBR8761243.1 hypothetical protein [Fusobacterium sp. DD25]